MFDACQNLRFLHGGERGFFQPALDDLEMVLIRPLRDGVSIRGGNKMNPHMLNLVSLHLTAPSSQGMRRAICPIPTHWGHLFRHPAGRPDRCASHRPWCGRAAWTLSCGPPTPNSPAEESRRTIPPRRCPLAGTRLVEALRRTVLTRGRILAWMSGPMGFCLGNS